MATTAGWDGVLFDITNETDCIPDDYEGGNCGMRTFGKIYMLSYLVICFTIIVNMHLVVILEFLRQAKPDKKENLSKDEINDFNAVWQQFDPESTEYISKDKLSDLLDILSSSKKPELNIVDVKLLEIPANDNDLVFYGDALIALGRTTNNSQLSKGK